MKIEYCHAVFREDVQMKTLSMSLRLIRIIFILSDVSTVKDN